MTVLVLAKRSSQVIISFNLLMLFIALRRILPLISRLFYFFISVCVSLLSLYTKTTFLSFDSGALSSSQHS